MTIPSHIGQYRIVRKIGAGGMGMVFLGEHRLLGRRAAIKTLLPTVAVNREIVERFFNEARATSAISDPGVIQIFDFGYHVDGTAYIVMELLEGEALSARIERLGRLPVGDALRIARQLAGSLATAHARGIVHRDLKPENVFLVSDSEAQGGERTKILDFGICKIGTQTDAAVTQSGAMIGTPVYMSPEQCRGAGGVDHRADIYAFGCLVFYMITGQPPFDGEAPGELIVAHMQATPALPSSLVPGLPPAIDALLMRCLAKSPEDRYQSMTELLLELGEIHALLDGAESTVSGVRPAMLLGRGFRSVYDANASALASIASRKTPVTGRLGMQRWLIATPPQPSSQDASSDDDYDDDHDDPALDLAPQRRRGVRLALACVTVVGVVLGLVVTSLVTHRDRDAGDLRPARAHAALAVDTAPAPPIEPARTPVVETAPTPMVGMAPAPAVEPASARAVEPAPARAVEPARPAVADASIRGAEHPSGSQPSSALSADRRQRSSREAPREIKKQAVQPRRRPAPAAPRPPAPSEDLYDTR